MRGKHNRSIWFGTATAKPEMSLSECFIQNKAIILRQNWVEDQETFQRSTLKFHRIWEMIT